MSLSAELSGISSEAAIAQTLLFFAAAFVPDFFRLCSLARTAAHRLFCTRLIFFRAAALSLCRFRGVWGSASELFDRRAARPGGRRRRRTRTSAICSSSLLRCSSRPVRAACRIAGVSGVILGRGIRVFKLARAPIRHPCISNDLELVLQM